MYLHDRAGQDVERKASVVYVMVDILHPEDVLGFCTLSAASLPKKKWSGSQRRRLQLPEYSEIPVTRLGRFAVDKQCQGRGYGKLLLFSALKRSYQQSIYVASAAVIVEAKGTSSAAFYKAHEFLPFQDNDLQLYLSMKTIELTMQSVTP